MLHFNFISAQVCLVFLLEPVKGNANTHSGSSFSPPPLKSLHLSPLLKRVREWMCHNRQCGCHGDSRSAWAGFLSRPLVKQTSKSRQRHSLVLTASFTSSTASITLPGTTLHHLSAPPGTPAAMGWSQSQFESSAPGWNTRCVFSLKRNSRFR